MKASPRVLAAEKVLMNALLWSCIYFIGSRIAPAESLVAKEILLLFLQGTSAMPILIVGAGAMLLSIMFSLHYFSGEAGVRARVREVLAEQPAEVGSVVVTTGSTMCFLALSGHGSDLFIGTAVCWIYGWALFAIGAGLRPA